MASSSLNTLRSFLKEFCFVASLDPHFHEASFQKLPDFCSFLWNDMSDWTWAECFHTKVVCMCAPPAFACHINASFPCKHSLLFKQKLAQALVSDLWANPKHAFSEVSSTAVNGSCFWVGVDKFPVPHCELPEAFGGHCEMLEVGLWADPAGPFFWTELK